MSLHPVPATSRRRLLGGALGGVCVALVTGACEVEADRGPSAPATGARTPASTDAPPTDPDARLVERVVVDLTGALALVGGAARARRSLAVDLTPWRTLHVAHLDALDSPGRARPQPVRGGAAEIRDRVRREETALQRRLSDASVAAGSGALAALLATMSAAVAQQLAADDVPTSGATA